MSEKRVVIIFAFIMWLLSTLGMYSQIEVLKNNVKSLDRRVWQLEMNHAR